MKLLLLAFTSIALAIVPARAADTPSKSAEEFYKAMRAKDYPGASKLFDPAALKSFREMLSFVTTLPEDQSDEVIGMFFGEGATKETVKKLSDTEFFATFFKGVMEQAEAAGGVDFGDMKVLGEVKEGEDVVHVVTRSKMTAGKIKVESMEVISFKKVDGDWKALLNGEMTGLAAQLKESFSAQQPQELPVPEEKEEKEKDGE